MKSNPKVVFIIVCWNNQDLLAECFDSIHMQTYKNCETIMIDNDSKDSSVEFTKQNYPWVNVYEAEANLGFAKGNNVALNYARELFPDYDYAVFLNSDARVAVDWVQTLIDFAETKPRGALYQTTTLDYYDHQIIDSTHIYISQNGSGVQGSWRSLLVGEKGPRKVFGVNAAAAMISRRFIEAQPFNRLFDETMFMYLEDVDLSARATIMGWDNYLVPGSFAYHMGSASSGKNPGFSLYMTYRNNIALLLKNIPASLLWKVLLLAMRSDIHTIRHLRRTGQGRAIPKLIKGRVVGFFRIPLYLPQIISMRRYRKTVNKHNLWALMLKGVNL